ncbi:McrB family protein [Clostridium celatum]|uniref:ATPase family protein n=1 Tax=Clostridium celatum DSM 1785 TaxID=545697 RepID=L1QGB2_9CLOT|nr:AAA family ATPase [Clostridium celatum]EKY26715.1 ATPase family protein [Clostridium celatum DSM 1785]MCE9653744.1 AAA family ATPase [Clostridium celatum]
MGKYAGTVALADIKCYRDKDRTDLVAEFKSFPEVRRFLNVQAVGDSLERASESGKPSRGYYWRVENLRYGARSEVDMESVVEKHQVQETIIDEKLRKFIEASKDYISKDKFFETLEDNKSKFIERFPLDKLIDMPIEEYIVLKANYPDTYNDVFTYWLERKKEIGGAIGGGNASKFYIYMDATGKYCIGYGNKKRYIEGDELKYEYNDLISKIVKSIEFAREDNIEGIKELNPPLWNMVLLKILSIYLPNKFIDVYSSSVLIPLAEILNLDIDKSAENIVEINYLATKKLKEMDAFKDWEMFKLSNFVWETISKAPRKITYWALGHNYDGDNILPDLIEKNKIAVGYFEEDLSDVIINKRTLKEYLKENNCDNNTIKNLSNFSEIKKDDIVILKSSFTKGEKRDISVFKISAVAKVLEDATSGYEYDERLHHTIPVEWISKEVREIEGINYLGTLTKIKNEKVLDIILNNINLPHEIEENISNEVDELNEDNKNFILYGPPGTGKTYNVINKALEIIDPEGYSEIAEDNREAILNQYKELVDKGQIAFCTFHQSYGYEEFIEGLKSDGKGNFVTEDGILKRISYNAAYEGLKEEYKEDELSYNDKKLKVNNYINKEKAFKEAKKFVLIIDEINRGNISKVFGELITLLEEDKRIGTSNQIVANLPYTKEKFSLPNNLYIIGTMNTSDKSIAQIDIALRRRFIFEEIMPNYEILDEIDGIELDKLLIAINERIEFLLDRDHLIGHAYFVNCNSYSDIINVVINKIIPLLQEYFYGDNEKVGMILGGIGSSEGDKYIVYKEEKSANKIFKGFKNISDIGSKEFFRVKSNIGIEELKNIYED